MTESSINARPMYFDRLSSEDQTRYLRMQELFGTKTLNFHDILIQIENFCMPCRKPYFNVENLDLNQALTAVSQANTKGNAFCYGSGYNYDFNQGSTSYDYAAERAASVKMLVCGVCFLQEEHSLAINYRQLRILADQTSSLYPTPCRRNMIQSFSNTFISSSLHKLGFSKVPSTAIPITQQSKPNSEQTDFGTELLIRLQFNHPEPSFLRQWTFYQMSPSTPEPKRPTFALQACENDQATFSSAATSSAEPLEDFVESQVTISAEGFKSPQPQTIRPIEMIDDSTISTTKFEMLKEDFYFADPLCLPPTFMLEDWA